MNTLENKLVSVEFEVLTDNVITDLLLNYKKSTTIHIEYIVDEAQSRQKQGKKVLQKHVKCTHVYLNHDYKNKVRNLTGNAEFEALAMKGKERVSSTFVRAIKSGELLLDGKILNFDTVTRLGFLHNGQPISEIDAIAEDFFAPAYFAETEKTTSGRGSVSVDDDFQMFTLGIKNLIYLKFNGKEYKR